MEEQGQESELYTAGIMSKGNYTSSRVAGSGLTGGTEVNGTIVVPDGYAGISGEIVKDRGGYIHLSLFGGIESRQFLQAGTRSFLSCGFIGFGSVVDTRTHPS